MDRKPFNIQDFKSNKESPVETRDGRAVEIKSILDEDYTYELYPIKGCIEGVFYSINNYDSWTSIDYLFSIDYCSTNKIINTDCLDCWGGLITTSIAHLSFDLIDKYDIYLYYKDKRMKIEEHMDLGKSDMDLHKGHNIFKIFRSGIFNYVLRLDEQWE